MLLGVPLAVPKPPLEQFAAVVYQIIGQELHIEMTALRDGIGCNSAVNGDQALVV